LILATPKLWVKLESFVSAYIIHLETCLNEDIGCQLNLEDKSCLNSCPVGLQLTLVLYFLVLLLL